MTGDFALTRRAFLRAAGVGGLALNGGVGGGMRRPPRAATCAGDFDGFDEYIQQAIADWQVPGAAVALVREGQVTFARGYGLRQAGKEGPVDENTIFAIASCTKSFTAAALALLVDRGKIRWDDALAECLPGLVLPESTDTARPTIRHALAHRTGLPAANMLWRGGAWDADEILRRLRHIVPDAAPGEKFLYNNLMYLAAGKIVEHAAGRPWSEFVQAELFAPLGMARSAAGTAGIDQIDNVAAPHAAVEGQVHTIDRHSPEAIGPAGTILSSAADMGRWLLFHLQRGRIRGRDLLSPARIDEMHAPVDQATAAPPADDRTPHAPMSRYGLGWFVNDHQGRAMVEHSGVQNGLVSWMAMLPNEQLGVVILSNNHQTGLNFALRSWLLDRLLGLPARDWSAIVREDYANGWQRELRESKAAFAARPVADMPPSLPVSSYAGTYENTLFGAIRVSGDNGRLALRFARRFSGHLEHRTGDAFRAYFDNPMLNDWLVTFALDRGQVVSLHAQEAPWAPEWYDDRDDLGNFRRT